MPRRKPRLEVGDKIVKEAGTPLNLTAVTSLKPMPLIVTTVPTGALFGTSFVIENVTV